MKLNKLTLLAVLAGCIAVGAPNANALSLTVGLGNTPYSVGQVVPGVDFANGDIPGYVNNFIGMALNSSQTLTYANHQNTWTRSGNAYTLPTVATTATGVSNGGTVTSFDVTTGFGYLVAKYDGPNGGLMVWNIAGLQNQTLTIPQNAFGDTNDKYGLSGSWLLLPQPGQSVPDGGATALLLGSALAGIGLLRRKLA